MSANVNTAELQSAIEAIWEERQGISAGTSGVVRDSVETKRDEGGRRDRLAVAFEYSRSCRRIGCVR